MNSLTGFTSTKHSDFNNFLNKYNETKSIQLVISLLNSLNNLFRFSGNPKELPVPNDYYIHKYNVSNEYNKTILIWDKFIWEVYDDLTVIIKYTDNSWEYKTRYHNILNHNPTQRKVYEHLVDFTIKSNYISNML